MRKVIAAGFLVLAIWVGAEVNDRGVDGAFNGLFVDGVGESIAKYDAQANRTKTRRTMDAFQRAYDKSESRVEHLLEPPAPVEEE